MTHNTYFRILSFWAKWFLPAPESKEVIEDYRELIAQKNSNLNLQSEFGSPKKIIQILVPFYEMVKWYISFVALCAFCLSGLIFWKKDNFQPVFAISNIIIIWLCMKFYFSKYFTQKSSKHSLFYLSTALITLGTILVFFLCLWIYHTHPVIEVGPAIESILFVWCTICSIMALLGIICARIQHKQWLSFCILCTGVSITCSMTVCFLAQLLLISSISKLVFFILVHLLITIIAAVNSLC